MIAKILRKRRRDGIKGAEESSSRLPQAFSWPDYGVFGICNGCGSKATITLQWIRWQEKSWNQYQINGLCVISSFQICYLFEHRAQCEFWTLPSPWLPRPTATLGRRYVLIIRRKETDIQKHTSFHCPRSSFNYWSTRLFRKLKPLFPSSKLLWWETERHSHLSLHPRNCLYCACSSVRARAQDEDPALDFTFQHCRTHCIRHCSRSESKDPI